MERLWGARGERWNGEEAQFNSRRTSYAFDEGGLEPCRRDDTITRIHHEASTSMREPIRIEFLLDVPLPPHTTTPPAKPDCQKSKRTPPIKTPCQTASQTVHFIAIPSPHSQNAQKSILPFYACIARSIPVSQTPSPRGDT